MTALMTLIGEKFGKAWKRAYSDILQRWPICSLKEKARLLRHIADSCVLHTDRFMAGVPLTPGVSASISAFQSKVRLTRQRRPKTEITIFC
jgi:hypothetical protein